MERREGAGRNDRVALERGGIDGHIEVGLELDGVAWELAVVGVRETGYGVPSGLAEITLGLLAYVGKGFARGFLSLKVSGFGEVEPVTFAQELKFGNFASLGLEMRVQVHGFFGKPHHGFSEGVVVALVFSSGVTGAIRADIGGILQPGAGPFVGGRRIAFGGFRWRGEARNFLLER